jgi:hypothetical protein
MPGWAWVALFMLVSVGCVLLGGHWLIPTAFRTKS